MEIFRKIEDLIENILIHILVCDDERGLSCLQVHYESTRESHAFARYFYGIFSHS